MGGQGMPITTQTGSRELPELKPEEEAEAEIDAALERRRVRKAAEIVNETTEQPRKKRQELDPPYNPMGMDILNSAKKGMEYQGETEARNPRASRMQEAIEDMQEVLNPQED